MHICSTDIDNLDKLTRVNLINSLSGFKSANLIGTADKRGQENLSIVSSVFHIGANPPLIGMIIRPHSVPRHTLENIIETGVYTINHVHNEIIEQAHQTSARYDKHISEFDAVGLQAQYKGSCKAPFVLQSKLKIAVKLMSTQTIELNQTELVIGQITDIYLEDDLAYCDDGFVDLERLNTVALSGLDRYHSTSAITRLSYAKCDKPLSHITIPPKVKDQKEP
ncbi:MULTISPECIES: flavin reductase family protein [Pseudoalteromonas]|uniref:Flavin oxidoreductase n=1 Tax=Pseudoalteromonas amylolytica TaxID=1859457 RepID=A0A1S1N115_9GAMM|nr:MULTISPECIES: flavin reductase family protein [Pseudoalteromonas]OHU85337.1 flavin oxidoreductase [Pseudoalteromonas sp. JW3]OHU93041.1 flavin oxidoreductase [Pseudoalteromonas amylolytica]